MPWHTLEFGTIINSQHVKSRSYFIAPTILNVASKVHIASGSTNSLLTNNDLRSLTCALSNLVPTSFVRISWSLKTTISSFRRNNASRTLVSATLPLPLNLSEVDVPANGNSYPLSMQANSMRRSATASLTKQMRMVASTRAMDMTILNCTIIPHTRFGCVVMLESKPAPTRSIYQLTVDSLPECNCPVFKDMISKFGRK